MSRQLHPGIFGDSAGGGFSLQPLEPLPSVDSDFADRRTGEIAEGLEKLRYDLDEVNKSTRLRLEKTAQKIESMEIKLSSYQKEAHERWALLAGKAKERQVTDSKMESLIERHNQIVQSFDLRLGQAQKLIENQALQLAKQQEVIDEARRQIEKLKRL